MIIKTTTGQSFKGCVYYNYTKVENDNGEILFSNSLSEDNSAKQVINDFNTQKDCYQSSHLEQVVIHTSISFSPEDRELSNDEIKKIAKKYIDRRGLSNTQYVVIKHTDREHPHIHIIANRVNNNNHLVDLRFNKQRDYEAARYLEKKNDLIIATNVKEKKINVERLTPADKLKHDLKSNLENCFKNSNTIDEFAYQLKEKNINFNYVYSKYRDGNIVGCSFERDGLTVSAGSIQQSTLHKKLQEKFLEKTHNHNTSFKQSFNENKVEKDIAKYQIKSAIDSNIPNCKSIYELKEKLQQLNIDCKEAINKDGKIVGIKFEKDNIKLNGSSIGKDYSLGALNGKIERQKWENKTYNELEKYQFKSDMRTAIDCCIDQSKSINELKEKIEELKGVFGSKMILCYDKENKQIIRGVKFEKNGLLVSGTELGKGYSYGALKSKIEKPNEYTRKKQEPNYTKRDEDGQAYLSIFD